MTIVPLLIGQESIFQYLQQMNGIYFIPIFAVVLVGIIGRRIPPLAAKVALAGGCLFIAVGYFVPPFSGWVVAMTEFHFLGLAFALIVGVMLMITWHQPLPEAWEQEYTKDVDMTPWKFAFPAGMLLVVIVLLIYTYFADFSVLMNS